jgi:DNA invertase Pin-like site-specific DNA recombinase
MLIGYVCVSSTEQNLDFQTNALKHSGCEKIFTDRASGSPSRRLALAVDHIFS